MVVRTRPLLENEHKEDNFEIVHTENELKKVYFFEPKISLRGNKATLTPETIDVDHSFGKEHDNQKVYEDVLPPLVDLSMQGGQCTVLAYGYSGSGKTFTIQGIMTRLAEDLFKR